MDNTKEERDQPESVEKMCENGFENTAQKIRRNHEKYFKYKSPETREFSFESEKWYQEKIAIDLEEDLVMYKTIFDSYSLALNKKIDKINNEEQEKDILKRAVQIDNQSKRVIEKAKKYYKYSKELKELEALAFEVFDDLKIKPLHYIRSSQGKDKTK